MENKFTIFLIVHNEYKKFKEVVERIYKYTPQPFNLLVIDNNSDKENKDDLLLYLPYENVKIIYNTENILCCKATNQALSMIDTEYAIYVCSRDCFIVDYGWELNCIDYMNNDVDVAMAGDMWALYDTYWKIVSKSLPKFRNNEWYKQRPKRDFVFNHIQGGFYILRMKAFKDVGGFNEEAFPQNGMDFEYSYYLQTRFWTVGKLDFVQSYDQHIKKNFYDDKVKIYHPRIPKK